MPDEKATTEEFRVQGEQIVEKLKDLLRQGNIRRVSIKDMDGNTLMDIPMTLGVIGALLLPQLAALGAIVVLAAHYRIAIEKAPEEI